MTENKAELNVSRLSDHDLIWVLRRFDAGHQMTLSNLQIYEVAKEALKRKLWAVEGQALKIIRGCPPKA